METLYTSASLMENTLTSSPPPNAEEVECKTQVTKRTIKTRKKQRPRKDATNREHIFVSLYNKLEIAKLFEGLKLAEVNGQEIAEDSNIEQITEFESVRTTSTISDKMFCTSCSCPFENRLQQKDHYRLDWHRFNQKQRIVGRQSVSEEEFEKIRESISSISGSDSSTSESDPERQEDLSPTSTKKVSFPHPSSHAGRQSETDSDDDESTSSRTHPKVMFKNACGQLLSIHRCLLHGKKNIPKENLELTLLAKGLTDRVQWLVLMAGGGHFAGAVFNGDTVVVHKTFHRYTVRAKRGTSQGLHDKQAGRNSKSVGANIRRYNETALVDDIHQVLKSWEDQIKVCTHVFLRAPSHNRMIFLGGKNAPFDKHDLRIVNIPFATRRPTFRELKRVQEILSTVHVHEAGTDINNVLRRSPAKTKDAVEKSVAEEASPNAAANEKEEDVTSGRKYQEPVPEEARALADLESDDEDGDIELVLEEVTTSTNHLKEFDVTKKKRRKRKPKVKETNEEDKQENKDPILKTLQYDIYTSCKTGNNAALQDLLTVKNSNDAINSNQSKSDTLSSDASVAVDTVELINEFLDASKITLLHVAAESGHRSIIWTLLEAGADPTIRNSKGLPPFSVSKDKETRNEFRRYMASFPDQHDYTKAQIPSPLTPEMEQEKAAKNAEKKKAQKKIKKSKQKEQKEEQKKQDEEEEKKRCFMALSDREKRAVAAERRMMMGSSTLRCWLCGKTVAGKPFSYLEFNFCSIDCLKEHKTSSK